MSDYVTRLFREALGRLEGEYRGEGLDAMALAARSLAADESKSYAAAHAVLDEGARLGERFDPFTYPALAMAATDDAIRRGGITVGSDSIDIERQLVQGGPRSAEPKRSSTYPSARRPRRRPRGRRLQAEEDVAGEPGETGPRIGDEECPQARYRHGSRRR